MRKSRVTFQPGRRSRGDAAFSVAAVGQPSEREWNRVVSLEIQILVSHWDLPTRLSTWNLENMCCKTNKLFEMKGEKVELKCICYLPMFISIVCFTLLRGRNFYSKTVFGVMVVGTGLFHFDRWTSRWKWTDYA